jgi:poly(3-hydroxybutyrate) depolymerase
VAVLVLAAVLLAPAAPAVATDRRINLNGGYYVAHRPPSPGPWLVMVLHSRANDEREPIAQGWSTLADLEGFTVVYPSRSELSWNAGLCCPHGSTLGRDDGEFLARVLQDSKARWRPRFVAVAGNSNGGMMAETLVWRRPWLTQRVAVWGSAPEMLGGPSAWTGRMLILHGADDGIVPWQGEPLAPWCACQLRPGQATRTYLPAAHLEAHVYAGLKHTPPSWWPARAWAALHAP